MAKCNQLTLLPFKGLTTTDQLTGSFRQSSNARFTTVNIICQQQK